MEHKINKTEFEKTENQEILLDILKKIIDEPPITYMNDDDAVGNCSYCGLASYEGHKDDCPINKGWDLYQKLTE